MIRWPWQYWRHRPTDDDAPDETSGTARSLSGWTPANDVQRDVAWQAYQLVMFVSTNVIINGRDGPTCVAEAIRVRDGLVRIARRAGAQMGGHLIRLLLNDAASECRLFADNGWQIPGIDKRDEFPVARKRWLDALQRVYDELDPLVDHLPSSRQSE